MHANSPGADMSHIICEPQAAQASLQPTLYFSGISLNDFYQVIKTYSPNIMVHPYMRQSHHAQAGMQSAEQISQKTIAMLDRLHAIVVGPGLGRDSLMLETAGKIIEAAKKRGMPIVVDAVWGIHERLGRNLFTYHGFSVSRMAYSSSRITHR